MSSDSDRVSIIAVDTGGTFTDVVLWDGATIRVVKVPSTPEDPSRAVLDGIARARSLVVATLAEHAGTARVPAPGGPPIPTGSTEQPLGVPPFLLIHGSTVATNALLERRGARIVLLTNAGFEDIIEIGRQNRPQLYALVGSRPPPLVPSASRIGIAGRLGPEGEEIEPLDEAELAALPARIDAEAVAICLLHSYANAAHEAAVKRTLEPLGVPLSVSSELLPEFREYERTATTVVNAYVSPVMDRYLGRLENEAGARRVRIMGSGGGAIPIRRARREAVHTILSGPAGGVMGGLAAARRAGFQHILTFDMGGTSTDVSLCPGQPIHTREFAIAGVPVAIPVLDIHTVGAGGGSIARVDAGGALRVGPESAGAVPGPICYGRGGTAITVTDAHVWLGRLPTSAWRHTFGAGSADPGGRGSGMGDRESGMGDREATTLDRGAVEQPLLQLAAELGTDAAAAAEGVITVADAAMEGALRVISVERGYDPADFTLVCFGGAAGLHAAALAERIGVPRVLVPPAPGALSAFGMLVAPVRKDVSRTVLLSARRSSEVELGPIFAELEERALEAMAEEGIAPGEVELRRYVDARYYGQSFELTVSAASWVERFHTAHETRYGHARRGGRVQAVTLRLEALALAPDAEFPLLGAADSATPEPLEQREVLFGGRRMTTPHFERGALRAGHCIEGPAIVSEYTATLWVPPAWTVLARPDASLLLVPVGVEAGR